jgi:NADH:ubiquinone oxidoreductase subunit 2 (subunit N)
LPPFSGFWSKWLLIGGAVKAGQWIPALVIALGSVVAAANYLRVARLTCFSAQVSSKPADARHDIAGNYAADSDEAHHVSGIAGVLAIALTAWSLGLGLLVMLPPVWNAIIALSSQAMAGGAYSVMTHP